MMELHVHMYYEDDKELEEYMEHVGIEETDYHTGKTKKIIYEKAAPGEGTASIFERVMGPLLDLLCEEDFLVDDMDDE
jgi:hypothetical protein